MSSSTSSVCEGLQSCLLEPHVVRMKLAPVSHSHSSKTESETPLLPSPNTAHDSDTKQNKTIGDTGGWSFLHSLYNKTHKSETDKVYVHPTVKRSSSVLSPKSLEMCTESLGCETGSDGSGSSDDIALFSLESSTKQSPTSESDRNCVSKRLNRRSASNFPPPLSSMRERGGFQVRPRREDGRLILEAVPTLSPSSYFRAERGNGRLTLRLLTTFHSCEDDDGAIEEEEAGTEAEAEEEDADDEAEEEEEEEEELEGNYENVEDETGMRKVSRPGRCNQTGDSSTQMLDWEPFCVAT